MIAWVRLHGFAIAETLRRLFRNPVANVFSIAILGLALALPVLAAIALRSMGAVTASLDTEPHANVYLALDATADDAKRIEQALKSKREVSAVRFIPRDKALDELKATTHLAEILASLDRNPLPDAFTVRLRTTDAQQVGTLRAEWLRLPKVDSVSADFEWAQKLARWVRFGDRLLAGLVVVLAGCIAFIVGHLIRLQVLTRREEIEVSQLIGATAADVRRPFLYHGAIQGAMAGAVGLAIAAGLALWVAAELQALTPEFSIELQGLLPSPSEWLGVCTATVALGLAGAWIAVSRELRHFSKGR